MRVENKRENEKARERQNRPERKRDRDKKIQSKEKGGEILLKIATLKEGETERDEEREIYGERKT